MHRAAIVVDLRVGGMPLSIVGTHMSHLQYGSHRNYADLKRLLHTEARPEAVLLGDMNLWGPPCAPSCPIGAGPSGAGHGRPGVRTARSTTSSCGGTSRSPRARCCLPPVPTTGPCGPR